MKTALTLKDTGDTTLLLDRLRESGLSTAEAESKCGLFARCRKALAEAGIADTSGARAFFVPGRIEVLGKHTDYAGGRSILAAAERGFCLLAADRTDSILRIIDAGGEEQAKFPVHADIMPTPGHWSSYPMTAARRIAHNFPGVLNGADIAFASDLPAAAGMSSSSALVTGIFLILSAVNDLVSRDEYWRNIESPEALAAYLGTMENGQSYGSLLGDRGVGTFGGSEDHTAILCCRPGVLSQYSFAPVRLESTIPVPDGLVFAIGSSGVISEKTGASLEKYNRISLQATALSGLWRKATGRDDPHIAAALSGYGSGAAEEMLRAVRRYAPSSGFSRKELNARLKQFMQESEYIIPTAAGALLENNLETFGLLVQTSHRNAAKLLHNQVPETDFLAKKACRIGALAASAFGAGFGGAVWALVREEHAPRFLLEWERHYRTSFPDSAAGAAFFTTHPGPAAFEL